MPAAEWPDAEARGADLRGVGERLGLERLARQVQGAIDAGDAKEAAKGLLALLAQAEARLGADQPECAVLREILPRSGGCEFKDIEAQWTRALAIREATIGPQHPDTVRVRHLLGSLYHALKQYDRAVPLLDESLRAIDARGDADYFWLHQIVGTLAICLRVTGDTERAEVLFRRSVAIAEHRNGERHAAAAAAHSNLGHFYERLERWDAAETHLRHCLEVLESLCEPFDMRVARAAYALASVTHKSGDPEEAERVYQQCVEICLKNATVPPGRPFPR